MSNRIHNVFQALRSEGRGAFMPFIAAGDPDLETSKAILLECSRRGADLIELGIPYSDPVADGAAIQAAFTRALDAGVSLAAVFEMLRECREEMDTPVVAMLSYSIVYRLGVEDFMARAAQSGFDGVIIPDLAVEESESAADAAAACGLPLIFLVAPTTSEARTRRILDSAGGFIYCVSSPGVTGVREKLPEELAERVRRLKAESDLPVAVGFGIATPEQVAMVTSVADGAIVGSALVKTIAAALDRGEDPVRAAGDFVERLAAAK